MSRIKIIVLVAGIALGYYGFKQWRLAGETKEEPQTITCKALGENCYGDNAYVKLTDFMVSRAGHVFKEKRRGKSWGKIWIPILAPDAAYAHKVMAIPDGAPIPPPTDFKVILQSEHVSGQSDLELLAQSDYLSGVVINEIDSLERKTKKLLQESYPGVDLDKCWILDHRRKPRSPMFGLVILLVGLALVGTAIWLFVKKK